MSANSFSLDREKIHGFHGFGSKGGFQQKNKKQEEWKTAFQGAEKLELYQKDKESIGIECEI